MKRLPIFVISLLMLSAFGCGSKHESKESDNLAQYRDTLIGNFNGLEIDTLICEPMDSLTQNYDTVGTHRTLNDIRFDGWGSRDWLDNEYIRTLRKYLDDYNAGEVSNSHLDPYKEQIRGKFVIYDIEPYLLGGAFIRITFIDMPDRVFSSWIYSHVDEKKGIIESYEIRSIDLEEEKTDLTKEDILQAVKEMEGLKLW